MTVVEYAFLLVGLFLAGAASIKMLGQRAGALALETGIVLGGGEAGRHGGHGSMSASGGGAVGGGASAAGGAAGAGGESDGRTRGVVANRGGSDGTVRPQPRPSTLSPESADAPPIPVTILPPGSQGWPASLGTVATIELHIVGDATLGGMDRAGIVAAQRVLRDHPEINYVDLVVYGRQSDGVLFRTSGGLTRASMNISLDDGALVPVTPPFAAGPLLPHASTTPVGGPLPSFVPPAPLVRDAPLPRVAPRVPDAPLPRDEPLVRVRPIRDRS